jgi:hypothetical protein
MSKLLIGIHGKPHAGKDTIADYLIDEYGFYKFGPSNPVKRTAAAMFNVPIECFIDPALKEKIDPFWKISYREMAQKVGKESSRDVFGEDFWMMHVGQKLAQIEQEDTQATQRDIRMGVVMADIRYSNEARWVKNNGGVVLFVERSDRARGYVANSGHAAEQGLPEDLADYIVSNDGDFKQLYRRIDKMVEWCVRGANKNE